MRANLKLVGDEPAAPEETPAKTDRRPLSEVFADVAWHSFRIAALLAGGAYVATAGMIVVEVWRDPDPGPADALGAGLLLLFTLVIGLWVSRRLDRRRRPEGPTVQVVEHFHHYPEDR